MSKYLYGASVQGIQGFIFETNKLQEIVGASEIVKEIEEDFRVISGLKIGSEQIIVNAAGNIKAKLDEKSCQQVVEELSKRVMQKAYGISISQAVVLMEGAFFDEQDAINELERKLKIQRNKPSVSLDMSLNIMELNPATSKAITHKEKKGKDTIVFNKASQQKRDAFPSTSEFKEISDLSNAKNKIAIIHADGNGLGELIPNLKDKGIKLSDFSIKLDEATREAFDEAKSSIKEIREVILGGDDLTVICNANDALNFTQTFLKAFEEKTEEKLKHKLTACAGIAYTNDKYPFHYAVSLAESLCSETKKHAKALRERKKLEFVPSSLMFHNIQSSNFQAWSKFLEDELSISNDKEDIYCDFGPYYLDEQNQPLISNFLNSVGAYACDGSPISRLRNWLSELGKSSVYSENLLKRINKMLEQSNDWNCEIMNRNLENLNDKLSNEKLVIEKDGKKKTPIYDILQILSVTETK